MAWLAGAPTVHVCCPHASSHSLPIALLFIFYPTSFFMTKGKINPGFLLLIINVQIPFQVKLTFVVNLPAYMNITKAPWTILSDILISATVSTRYLPPSCGSRVWRFSRVAILGMRVFYECVCVCILDGLLELCVCMCVSGY